MAGLGGGVIIKPILDALGNYDLVTISILSSGTVLAMAVVSTIKYIRAGFNLNRNMYVLTIGSIVGGAFGKELFSIFVSNVDASLVKGFQAVILAILLFIVIFKDQLPKIQITNLIMILLIGILLGTIAAFLGIGGGPINVAILCMLLGFNTKDAAVISIFIILFSQLSKLVLIYFDTEFVIYKLTMLWFMIPGGILGGIIGSKLNRKLRDNHINIVFKIMLVFIIVLNFCNAIIAFTEDI